jgi:hypothetical protein
VHCLPLVTEDLDKQLALVAQSDSKHQSIKIKLESAKANKGCQSCFCMATTFMVGVPPEILNIKNQQIPH